MTRIVAISEDSELLEGVKRLWRQNSSTLGFYTDGAFAERAQRGQVLAAVDGNSVVGYVVFFLNRRTLCIRLTHLCVDDAHRGRGVARILVAELRQKVHAARGISLNCRRDFEVCRMWPKLGFQAVAEKAGKAKDGSELVQFWMPLNQKGLFEPNSELDEERLSAAIDLNILRDFLDHSRNGASETLGLEADWLQSFVQFCVTEELFNEIQRLSKDYRSQLTEEANKYIPLESSQEEFEKALVTVSRIYGRPASVNEESDQRHLARSIASKCDVFLTRDGPILDRADEIYEAHGLLVLRPSQMIAQIQELRNEKDYQRNRLSETDLKIQRLSRPTNSLRQSFQLGTESHKALESKSRLFESHPDRFWVEEITSTDGSPLALVAYDFGDSVANTVTVSILRLQKSVQGTRLAGTLARALITRVLDFAASHAYEVVRIEEPLLCKCMCTALHDRGFRHEKDSWFKFCLPVVGNVFDVCDRVKTALSKCQHGQETAKQILTELNDPDFLADPSRVLLAEHILSPAKILGSTVRNFVVSIRPEWAEDLLDSRLSKTRLWRADSSLALSPESVYYRSRKNSPFGDDTQGRLLWYVSDDRKIPGAKKLRACSQLTNVVVGLPKDLFRRFRRFGVYEWQDVLDTAGAIDATLMAMEFADTELFDANMNFSDVDLTLQKHGQRSAFQSPVKIEETVFTELYKTGVNRDC